MDVLAVGFVLGVGTTWLARRRGRQLRGALAWTARQSGWISGQVAARLAEASRLARAQYESGRASVATPEVPAPSREGALSADAAGTSPRNGSHSAAPSKADLSSGL
jgi:hypothetical protein